MSQFDRTDQYLTSHYVPLAMHRFSAIPMTDQNDVLTDLRLYNHPKIDPDDTVMVCKGAGVYTVFDWTHKRTMIFVFETFSKTYLLEYYKSFADLLLHHSYLSLNGVAADREYLILHEYIRVFSSEFGISGVFETRVEVDKECQNCYLFLRPLQAAESGAVGAVGEDNVFEIDLWDEILKKV